VCIVVSMTLFKVELNLSVSVAARSFYSLSSDSYTEN
jgi:hypothetical protein